MDFIPEHSTKPAAAALAARIRDYWLARGYAAIRTGVVLVRGAERGGDLPVYAVVSNIGGHGYPPRY